jgi:hypothetical protein
MAIPNGTKFHGVAPSVDTKNKGSEQANAMRDAYTIEEIGSKIEFGNTAILEPEFITATPGGSLVITTTKNIIDLTWSFNTAFSSRYSLSFFKNSKRLYCYCK